VEIESRCEREWTRPGRGDFLVADGERLVFLGSSRAFDGCGVLGLSSLACLSAGLGAVQANLMVHGRFGASFAGASVVAGCDVGGAATFAAASFLPPHAKVIHRFLGATGAAGCDLGDTLMPSPTIDSLLGIVVIDGAASVGGCMDLFDGEKGPKPANMAAGGGGLGVLVREGLVSPSLVSSAVDAMLALLIMDRRRDKSVLIRTAGFEVVVSGLFNAIVSRDSFRLDWACTADF
jgi:hypothetical protein